MKKNNNLFFVCGVIIFVVILILIFTFQKPKTESSTILLDAQPTTADIGVSGDNLVLPADQSFYLQIEDGHVTDVIMVDDTKEEETE